MYNNNFLASIDAGSLRSVDIVTKLVSSGIIFCIALHS